MIDLHILTKFEEGLLEYMREQLIFMMNNLDMDVTLGKGGVSLAGMSGGQKLYLSWRYLTPKLQT